MTTAGTREKNPPPMPITATDPETKKMLEIMSKMPRGCEAQISTGSFTYITDIKNRRVLIGDEQKGLVVGFSMFWHRSDVKTVKVKGIPGVEEMPSYQGIFNLPAMHIYKIKKAKLTKSRRSVSLYPMEPGAGDKVLLYHPNGPCASS